MQVQSHASRDHTVAVHEMEAANEKHKEEFVCG